MVVTAKLRYLRIAPRKVRLIADLIRGKKVDNAQIILNLTTKKTAGVLLKLLKQAIANAKNNFQLEEPNLYISRILVDEGPKLKRFMPRARGTAYEIQKKTSHITIILDEIEKRLQKAKKPKTAQVSSIEKAPVGKIEGEKITEVEKTQKEGPETEKIHHEADKLPKGQAKLTPQKETFRPKIERGIKRIFRRKAF